MSQISAIVNDVALVIIVMLASLVYPSLLANFKKYFKNLDSIVRILAGALK